MPTYNYNTDTLLWVNASKSKDLARLTVCDGHVYGEYQCIARFTDDNHAISTLEEAGYENKRSYQDRGPVHTVMVSKFANWY